VDQTNAKDARLKGRRPLPCKNERRIADGPNKPEQTEQIGLAIWSAKI